MDTIHVAGLDWVQEDLSHKTNLIDLLAMASFLECADPRDHIYSLLDYPLARLPGKTPIVKPDYTKPASDVYYMTSLCSY
jgi:hypothetical protein